MPSPLGCFHPRVFPGKERAICSLGKLFWMVVAAITVYPSSCCYARTGFGLGHGQGSHSADPGSGLDGNSSVPFLSALSHPLFSNFWPQYIASQLFFKALSCIHPCLHIASSALLSRFPLHELSFQHKRIWGERGLCAVIHF